MRAHVCAGVHACGGASGKSVPRCCTVISIILTGEVLCVEGPLNTLQGQTLSHSPVLLTIAWLSRCNTHTNTHTHTKKNMHLHDSESKQQQRQNRSFIYSSCNPRRLYVQLGRKKGSERYIKVLQFCSTLKQFPQLFRFLKVREQNQQIKRK